MRRPSSRLAVLLVGAALFQLSVASARRRSAAGIATWRTPVLPVFSVRVRLVSFARRTVGDKVVLSLTEVAPLRQRAVGTLGGDVAAEITAVIAPEDKQQLLECGIHILLTAAAARA